MKLVIDRSRWIRGLDPRASYLIRREDQKMCCLGFYGLACGVPSEELLGKFSPNDSKTFAALQPWLISEWSALEGMLSASCNNLMRYNDSILYDSNREKLITLEFAKHGVEVEFIDGDNQ